MPENPQKGPGHVWNIDHPRDYRFGISRTSRSELADKITKRPDILETSTDNIGLHLKNIYASGELEETATTEDFSVVQQEGPRSVSRKTKHYNLDAIISVGYRVNSKRGTQFRQWATSILRDHLMRSWTLDRAQCEHNAAELEAALTLVKKTAQSSDLIAETGRGLIESQPLYLRASTLHHWILPLLKNSLQFSAIKSWKFQFSPITFCRQRSLS